MELQPKTQNLLERLHKASEWHGLDKKSAEKKLGELYAFHDLKLPTLVWLKSPLEEKFLEVSGASRASWASGASRASRASWASGASRASGASGASRASWVSGVSGASGASRASGASGASWASRASLDYDFDFLLDSLDWLEVNVGKGNEHDKKYHDSMELFIQLKELGLGYMAEDEKTNTLYLAPKPIIRLNALFQHHSTNLPGIEWENAEKFYFLNGVHFEEEMWRKVVSGTMPFRDILAIKDIDQRTQAMRFGDVNKFLKHSKAEKLDERLKFTPEGKKVNYALYKIPKGDIFTEDAYYAVYDCPSSDRVYMSGVEKCDTVAEALAWKFQISPEEWSNLKPMITES